MVVTSVAGVLERVVIMSCNIYLASDYRLDLRILLCYFQELLHTIHVTMVCNGQRRHSELFCALKKTPNRGLAVKN